MTGEELRRQTFATTLALALVAVSTIACGREGTRARGEPSARAAAPQPSVRDARREAAAPEPPPAATPGAGKAAPLVVFLGDSLTAGLGLDAEQAWPSLLAERLAEAGTPIRAVNAGVSGDTSAGGVRRLSWLLRQRPDVVVVELGANDGLRGQPVAGIEANLRAIVEQARAAGARVLLLGIQVPPSLGHEYVQQFADVYPRVARELDVPLVPFMLAGVAGDPELNLPDGIHPNAEGQQRVAEVVRPYLADVIAEPAAAPGR